ncbi:MAG: rod shape-determining protein RodA [Gammaproteobacteria bacterium]|jgi:rod shape determining protein RodA|nr:rod shape-determining protein RodA [Gammaproteobacteria bacterium]MBK6584837.1 rod shape-determining protein RodA [Gammaproteobacteria bacterium]MBK7519653.1 rod shape-determining protein RodA [Gammaproteobacteria bacterium]MBK7731102.1 rod shape-determining protein RodA [Gammaproteobacteria bacterium]MBK8306615.1 rod shape-determining protein RodA [Gammaproteobacteria bacterium]
MRRGDFQHQMPESARDFGRRPPLSERLHVDLPLLGILLLLSSYGLVVLYSASGREFEQVLRQGVFLGLGFLAMFGVAQVSVQTLRRWTPWAYLIGLLLLLAVDLVGIGAKGAQRWLAIPGLPRFQPSEIMKLLVPLMVASYLAAAVLPPRLPQVCLTLVIVLLPAALVVLQPDLGTAVLIAAAGVIVLFLAGLGWRYVFAVLLAVAIAAPVMWKFVLYDYQKQRVMTMLNPESDKLGAGWNIIQSKTAIGSGGMEGKGWLEGTQSHLDFLPEGHTDFIIAVLAEEFGFEGVAVLLAIYLMLIARALWIALRAQDSFSRLIAGGLTLTFFVYIVVNMGMVSGLLPVVGVPLPLVSQGGTALISLLGGFGIVMAVATERRRLLG